MPENETNKKVFSKKMMMMIMTAVLIIGGGVAAFFLITGSPKIDYIKAEKNTADFLTDKVAERYQPEFDWSETAMENSIENNMELSAQYHGPPLNTNGIRPEQIINSSTLSVTSQVNRDDNQLATDVAANFGGMQIDNIKLFADSDNAFLELPFLEETLTIQDTDLNKMLQEDPDLAGAEINFESLFDQLDGALSEEDRDYLMEEYPKMMFKELPEDAFETDDDSVTVGDESVDADKVTVHLSEEQLKDVITKVLEKAKDDKSLKEIYEKQVKNQFGMFAAGSLPDDMEAEVNTAMENFEPAIDKAIDRVDDLQMPDGLTSVIWVKDDLIVKRDFSIAMAPEGGEATTLSVTGEQMLTDTDQDLTYDVSVADSTATIAMNLSREDHYLEDTITIAGGDMELSYDGESTLEDGTREFDRTFSLSTPKPNGSGSLNWSGTATYDNDRKKADHTLSLTLPNVPQDMVRLTIQNDAKTIKKVDQPDDSNVKDLGGMSSRELEQYVQTEVAGQFQQWLMELIGAPGGGSNSL